MTSSQVLYRPFTPGSLPDAQPSNRQIRQLPTIPRIDPFLIQHLMLFAGVRSYAAWKDLATCDHVAWARDGVIGSTPLYMIGGIGALVAGFSLGRPAGPLRRLGSLGTEDRRRDGRRAASRY